MKTSSWESLSLALAQLSLLDLYPREIDLKNGKPVALLTRRQAEKVMENSEAVPLINVGPWYAENTQANATLNLEHVVLTWYVLSGDWNAYPEVVSPPAVEVGPDQQSLSEAAAVMTSTTEDVDSTLRDR